jgi:glycine cleavage system H protein
MPEFLEISIDKFIFRVATDRLYTAEGAWAERLSNGAVRVGITDYAQQRDGDVAFVHVKPAGTSLAKGEELAEMETIKANQSIFSPVAGRITEVNAALSKTPEVVNQAPYGRDRSDRLGSRARGVA